MEEEAYKLIPAGMGETLKACPLQMDDYTHLASELDSIIDTLKKCCSHSSMCSSSRATSNSM